MPKIKEPTPDQLVLLTQLKSLVESYRREMPIGGKSTWPVCIRERVEGLARAGMSYRQISIRTSIPYDTMVSWPVRKTFTEAGFVELKVNHSGTGGFGLGTVTSPPTLPSETGLKLFCGELRIEGLSLREVMEILSRVQSRAA